MGSVIFVRPGDLHLTTRDQENFRVAEWMVDEVSTLIRPDFVQFAGDNAQNARPEEFALFLELAGRLGVPWHPMVGDHDAADGPEARNFRGAVGPTYASFALAGQRFIRLNTNEARPVGLGEAQLDWLEGELVAARAAGERVVLFQHHYPFKVFEEFEGPGIARWRSLVQKHAIEAIFTGHTHYGQIANDGRNVSIATRSIGDPEGGPPGYHVVCCGDGELALAYRTIEDRGPAVLITSPRDEILARGHEHIVREDGELRVLTWAEDGGAIERVQAMVGGDDGGSPIELSRDFDWSRPGVTRWRAPLPSTLAKGRHSVRAIATDSRGREGTATIRFVLDPTGRYTAVPRVEPWVDGTAFC